MNRSLIAGLWIAMLGTGASIDAQGSAMQNAARLGYSEFERLHTIIAPLMSKAYPSKDKSALILAAVDIQDAVSPLEHMSFKTHNDFKFKAFKNGVAKSTQIAGEYLTAAQASDSQTVMTLFPQLQEELERTAAAVLPVSWREFESLKKLADSLAAKKIKNDDDKEPYLADIDRVQGAMAAFAASPIPTEINYRSALIGEERDYFVKLSARMRETLGKNDLPKFRDLTKELSVRLGTFVRMYLQ